MNILKRLEGSLVLNFDDVVNCQDIAELNEFISKYLKERNLVGAEQGSIYRALFYKWRDSVRSKDCPLM